MNRFQFDNHVYLYIIVLKRDCVFFSDTVISYTLSMMSNRNAQPGQRPTDE